MVDSPDFSPAALAQTELTLQVNYDRSIEDAIADGKYDWKNHYITSENFFTTRMGTATITLHLLHFNRDISSEEAILEMERHGLRPAETHELLALGATYPDLQGQFLIIALGSVWQDRDGDRHVPYLNRDNSMRNLNLVWFGGGWHTNCRFAAVPK